MTSGRGHCCHTMLFPVEIFHHHRLFGTTRPASGSLYTKGQPH